MTYEQPPLASQPNPEGEERAPLTPAQIRDQFITSLNVFRTVLNAPFGDADSLPKALLAKLGEITHVIPATQAEALQQAKATLVKLQTEDAMQLKPIDGILQRQTELGTDEERLSLDEVKGLIHIIDAYLDSRHTLPHSLFRRNKR